MIEGEIVHWAKPDASPARLKCAYPEEVDIRWSLARRRDHVRVDAAVGPNACVLEFELVHEVQARGVPSNLDHFVDRWKKLHCRTTRRDCLHCLKDA